MRKFVTSDLHFHHENMIKYCNRPFKTMNEMHEVMIERWNKKVSPSDQVYVLGDFCWGDSIRVHQRILKKLNGCKFLIIGNHDEERPRFYISAGFRAVYYPYFEIDDMVLCHDPALSQVDRSRKFLVGHIHDLFKTQKNCINVGVDVWDFYPQDIEFLKENFICMGFK